jgi:hypothetical protein
MYHPRWNFQIKTQVCLYFNGNAWIETWILLGGGRWRVPRMTHAYILTCRGEMIFPHRCVVGVIVPHRCQVACFKYTQTSEGALLCTKLEQLHKQTPNRLCKHLLGIYYLFIPRFKNYLYRCLNPKPQTLNLSTQSCLNIWNLYRQQAICWAINSMDSTSVGWLFEFLKNPQFWLFEKNNNNSESKNCWFQLFKKP